MNVLDSSGWIEFFTEDTNFEIFAPVVRNYDDLFVPTIVVIEVLKFIRRESGEEDAFRALHTMRNSQFIPLSEHIALKAVENNFAYQLPLADSIIFATAQTTDATLWTQDRHFKNIEGVKYFPK